MLVDQLVMVPVRILAVPPVAGAVVHLDVFGPLRERDDLPGSRVNPLRVVLQLPDWAFSVPGTVRRSLGHERLARVTSLLPNIRKELLDKPLPAANQTKA